MSGSIDRYIQACNELLQFLSVSKRDWDSHFQALDEMDKWSQANQDRRTEIARRSKWRSELICSTHKANICSLIESLNSSIHQLSVQATPALLLAKPFLPGEYAFSPIEDGNGARRAHLILADAVQSLRHWIDPLEETSDDEWNSLDDNAKEGLLQEGWGDGCFPVPTDTLIEISQAINREYYLLAKAEELLENQAEKGVSHSFAIMEEAAAATDEQIRQWLSIRRSAAIASATPPVKDLPSKLKKSDLVNLFQLVGGARINPDTLADVLEQNDCPCDWVGRRGKGKKGTRYFHVLPAIKIVQQSCWKEVWLLKDEYRDVGA